MEDPQQAEDKKSRDVGIHLEGWQRAWDIIRDLKEVYENRDSDVAEGAIATGIALLAVIASSYVEEDDTMAQLERYDQLIAQATYAIRHTKGETTDTIEDAE